MKAIMCLLIALIASGCAFAQRDDADATWTARVKVLDENGKPVSDANVSVSFYGKPFPGQVIEDARDLKRQITGPTDANGEFMASHTDRSFTLGIAVEKNGYYSSHSGYDLASAQADRNPTITIVLKKIGNAIPMYAKWIFSGPRAFRKTGRPPISFDTSIGYDLIAGDWVAPFGKGVDTNILFTEKFNKQSITDFDYELTVSFPNGGGIQEFESPAFVQDASEGASDLRSPHEAPTDGYRGYLTLENSHHPDGADKPDGGQSRSYFVRVATSTGTLYGKIYGDILMMNFSYYLNPTPNDRNIEFDPHHNLLRLKRYDLKVTSP